MPEQKAIIARLQTPKDENGERKDIFLKTSADAVIFKDGEGNEKPLDEVLTDVKDEVDKVTEDIKEVIGEGDTGSDNPIVRGMDIPVISSTEPEKSCLWLKPDSSV